MSSLNTNTNIINKNVHEKNNNNNKQPIQHIACTSVGMTQFVNNRERPSITIGEVFHGTLKSQTSDFIVSEIDKDGKIADLKIEYESEDDGKDNNIHEKLLKKKLEKKQDVNNSKSTTPFEKYQQSMEIVNNTGRYDKILGGKKNTDEVDQFAATILKNRNIKYKDDDNNNYNNDNNINSNSLKINIPSCEFSDRETKRLIHQSVTFKYPFLETKIIEQTTSIGKKKVSQLIVHERKRFFDTFKDCLSMNNIFKLEAYYVKGPFQPDKHVIFEEIKEKSDRRKVHNLLNLKCKWCRTSTTKNNEIIVSFRRNNNSNNGGKKKKATYTRIVLRKNGIDQGDALRQVSRLLGIPRNSISVAGTKDKYSISYQFITVQNSSKENIIKKFRQHQYKNSSVSNNSRYQHNGICVGLKVGSIAIGNYFKVNSLKALNLGDLYGNKFEIILRQVHKRIRPDSSSVNNSGSGGVDCMNDANGTITGDNGIHQQIDFNLLNEMNKCICNNGFINYFGLQRLGKFYHVDSPRSYIIGAAILQGNWEKAIELLLKPRIGENYPATAAKIYFKKTMNAKEALNKMPRHLHHERYVLKGLNRYGKAAYLQSFKEIPYNNQLMYAHAFQSFLWNHMASKRWEVYQTCCRDRTCMKKRFLMIGDLLKNYNHESNPREKKYIEITKDNYDTVIENMTYTIYDIVIPLPGRLTERYIRENDVYSKLVTDLLLSFDLSWDNAFRQGEYRLKGAYRSFLTRPRNFKCNIVDNDTLKLEFELNSSSYATVCLREYMKNDMIMACEPEYKDWKEFLDGIEHSLVVNQDVDMPVTTNNNKRRLGHNTVEEEGKHGNKKQKM